MEEIQHHCVRQLALIVVVVLVPCFRGISSHIQRLVNMVCDGLLYSEKE